MAHPDKSYFDSLTYPKVAIIGGGFAGLTLVKLFENQPFKVTLYDKNNFHTFQPLLYQVATGSLAPDNIAYPFRRKIAEMKNVNFRQAELLEIKPETKEIVTNKGTFDFDYLIVATGSKTNFFGNENLAKWAMQLKSVSQALDIRSDFLQEFEEAIYLTDEHKRKQVLNFVVVGGGPTGVEVSGALAEIRKNILATEYKEVDADLMQISLIQAGPRLLEGFSEKSSRDAKDFLEKMGVHVLLDTRVENYDGQTLYLGDGITLATETVIWSAGVMGAALPGLSSEAIGRGNRYVVNEFNQVKGYDSLYAIGDVALMQCAAYPNGHPQVAPVAIQQAELLVKNLLRLNKNEALKPFTYKDKGSMATIGRYKAVVDIGKLHLNGTIAWFVWMFVHLMSIVGFKNRIVVLVNWAMKYFSYRNVIRLIIRPYTRYTS